jgi:hypothetical protein
MTVGTRTVLVALVTVMGVGVLGLTSVSAGTAAIDHTSRFAAPATWRIAYMPTFESRTPTAVAAASPGKVTYHGGPVETQVKVVMVLWGSQWNTKKGDPDHESQYLSAFFRGLFGPQDTWSTAVTQYCQGATLFATSCGPAATGIVHPSASPLTLQWADTTAPAPHRPTDQDFVKELTKAASHVGHTTEASNRNVQYLIMTSSGNSTDGFAAPDGYCAFHATDHTKYGDIAFVNLPYQPDAGGICGAGEVNRGHMLDGASIVAGHEYVEAITDPFISPAWYYEHNGNQDEIADKCQDLNPGQRGGPKNITLSTGTFPVQGVWSNNDAKNGGCVTSYVSATNQH